jgi:uncharacterized membrane protein YtjA (UPF0391 family)
MHGIAHPHRTATSSARGSIHELGIRPERSTPQEVCMLHYAVVFFVIALIAAVLGFTGIAGAASNIAWILFVVFVVLAVISLLRGRRPAA